MRAEWTRGTRKRGPTVYTVRDGAITQKGPQRLITPRPVTITEVGCVVSVRRRRTSV